MLLCVAAAVAAFTLSIKLLFVIYFIAFTLHTARTFPKKGVCAGGVFAVVTAEFVLWVVFRVERTVTVTCGALPSPLSLSVLPHPCIIQKETYMYTCSCPQRLFVKPTGIPVEKSPTSLSMYLQIGAPLVL